MRLTLNQLETALKCFDVDSTLCARMRFICGKFHTKQSLYSMQTVQTDQTLRFCGV